MYMVTLILFLVFTCFNCIKSENYLAFQHKNIQFMKVCKQSKYLNMETKANMEPHQLTSILAKGAEYLPLCHFLPVL